MFVLESEASALFPHCEPNTSTLIIQQVSSLLKQQLQTRAHHRHQSPAPSHFKATGRRRRKLPFCELCLVSVKRRGTDTEVNFLCSSFVLHQNGQLKSAGSESFDWSQPELQLPQCFLYSAQEKETTQEKSGATVSLTALKALFLKIDTI